MKIEGVTCLRYHRGVDGLGTCDDKCQWWVEGYPCPYWFYEKTYQRIKGIWVSPQDPKTINPLAKEMEKIV